MAPRFLRQSTDYERIFPETIVADLVLHPDRGSQIRTCRFDQFLRHVVQVDVLFSSLYFSLEGHEIVERALPIDIAQYDRASAKADGVVKTGFLPRTWKKSTTWATGFSRSSLPRLRISRRPRVR